MNRAATRQTNTEGKVDGLFVVNFEDRDEGVGVGTMDVVPDGMTPNAENGDCHRLILYYDYMK
ncbi:MAG: hypothetical protein AAFR81_12855 [Chloroflexota bacterium]